MFRNRRAISPLAATVMLILLSIALGAAVMSWGEDYIEARAEFVQGVQETITSCDLVSFSLIRLYGVQQLCQEGNLLKGLIDNGPDADITDFHARIVSDSGVGVVQSVMAQSLPRASAAAIQFKTGTDGVVAQVKLTPEVIAAGKPMLCTKQALIIENIPPC
jgi:hypothetical protein